MAKIREKGFTANMTDEEVDKEIQALAAHYGIKIERDGGATATIGAEQPKEPEKAKEPEKPSSENTPATETPSTPVAKKIATTEKKAPKAASAVSKKVETKPASNTPTQNGDLKIDVVKGKKPQSAKDKSPKTVRSLTPTKLSEATPAKPKETSPVIDRKGHRRLSDNTHLQTKIADLKKKQGEAEEKQRNQTSEITSMSISKYREKKKGNKGRY